LFVAEVMEVWEVEAVEEEAGFLPHAEGSQEALESEQQDKDALGVLVANRSLQTR
jgi:hypothetical protein